MTRLTALALFMPLSRAIFDLPSLMKEVQVSSWSVIAAHLCGRRWRSVEWCSRQGLRNAARPKRPRIGASMREHLDERTIWPNGHRERLLTMQADDLDKVPMIWTGSFLLLLLVQVLGGDSSVSRLASSGSARTQRRTDRVQERPLDDTAISLRLPGGDLLQCPCVSPDEVPEATESPTGTESGERRVGDLPQSATGRWLLSKSALSWMLLVGILGQNLLPVGSLLLGTTGAIMAFADSVPTY